MSNKSHLLPRPWILLKAAISLDGFMDDNAAKRLVLSSDVDLAEVKQLRSTFDAILVGAETLRRDNPGLDAVDAAVGGKPLLRVSFSATGDLESGLRFFRFDGKALLYLAKTAESAFERLGKLANCVLLPTPRVNLSEMLSDLQKRGVKRLLVEGGPSTLAAFICEGSFDEFRLAIAPVILSDRGGARLAFETNSLFLRSLTKNAGTTVLQLTR